MGYPDRGYVVPRDTRKYGGLIRRTLWRLRRHVERELSFALADIDMYRNRARWHAKDGHRDRYLQEYSRSKFMLDFVWRPLARILGAVTPFALEFDAIDAGKRSIAAWLDENSHLKHSAVGSMKLGMYCEWFSLDPAPWSGEREDWLLWILDEDQYLVDGPLNSLQAQATYMTFAAEVDDFIDMLYEESYHRYGYYQPEVKSEEVPWPLPMYDQPSTVPFGTAIAHGLSAREIDDRLVYDDDIDPFDPYDDDYWD